MKKKIFVPILLSLLLVFSFVSITKADTTAETSAIPIMTSNTSPSGIVSASESYSQTPPWMAFDGIKNYATTSFTAWGTSNTSGWIAYEFPTEKVITKYVIYFNAHTVNGYSNGANPKNWTFEGSNDGSTWTVLDTQNNVTSWTDGEEKAYNLKNTIPYKNYRLNVSANNGQINNSVNLTIHELAMFEKAITTPDPTVTPTITPSPTPEQPTGDRAILVVTMNTGLEKEFDLPMSEVNAFLNWYDTASGSARYGIDKHNNNKGPFTSRKDYVIFDKILTFSVDEY